jgi:hypothetical protein
LRLALEEARGLASKGHETFNNDVIGPLMKKATSEEFAQMAARNVKSPTVMAQVKEIVFDPRYREARHAMGVTDDGLWAGIRGQHLLDEIQEVSRGLGEEVMGEQFLKRIQKRQTQALMKSMWSPEELGRVRELGRAVASTQKGLKGGKAGRTAMTLTQVSAGVAIASPTARDEFGLGLPAAIFLGPVAMGYLFTRPALVQALNRGLSNTGPGREVLRSATAQLARATGMKSDESRNARKTMDFLIRELAQAGVPFEVELGDGTIRTVATTARDVMIPRALREGGRSIPALRGRDINPPPVTEPEATPFGR